MMWVIYILDGERDDQQAILTIHGGDAVTSQTPTPRAVEIQFYSNDPVTRVETSDLRVAHLAGTCAGGPVDMKRHMKDTAGAQCGRAWGQHDELHVGRPS